MEQFEKTIDYFIQYEIMNRFNNIELKEGKGIHLSKETFLDVENTRSMVNENKADKIKNLLKKIKFKDSKYGAKILPDILQLLICNSEKSAVREILKSIIDKGKYSFPDDYDSDIYAVSSIITDNMVLVLYPILACGKRKVPLITFECEIEKDKYVIKNYKVQQEAFRVIVASIINCGIREVHDALGDEFYKLLSSLSGIENPDIFETIEIINEDMKGRFSDEGFTGIWSIKDYERWAVTEELVITIEAFNELQQPIFREELKHLKELKKNSGVPSIIQKYLYSNKKSQGIDCLHNGAHYGSYDSNFSVNEKQWKVISAYNSSELISVSGPPGTGKTTILKEIIADNFVRKVKDLISVWDEPWEEFGQGNQKVFCSPFNGECNKSMVLTSTNNDAIDNIGLELLREVEYFKDIAQEHLAQQYKNEKLKGIFCARLGRRSNMDTFNVGALKPLINLLKGTDDYDEQLSLRLIDNFNQGWELIASAETEIKDYINSRTSLLNQLVHNGIIQEEATIELVQNVMNELQNSYDGLTELINDNEKGLCVHKDKMIDITKLLTGAENNIKQENADIENINKIVDQIRKYRKIPLIGDLVVKITKVEKKKGTQEELEKQLEEKKRELSRYSLIKENMFREYEESNKNAEAIKSLLQEQKKNNKTTKEKLVILGQFQTLTERFDSIKRKYLLNCDWDTNEYLLFNDISFVKKRNQLFNLGIKINELYICKNKKEIIFNLEKIYPDNWFRNFFRKNFKYDKVYEMYIKSMWETLFLCFPVVTTTLHSFDKGKFHMIEGIFDTIMFDESGQALLHTAVAPLFRARKAVIVGDVFQLEPIRGVEERLVESYEFEAEIESLIDIERNSVQNGADRGSDVYEMLNNQRVGIILDEHRRCEKAIVEFSNKNVYENRLKIIKGDESKEFFERNLCFIDVRGTKNKYNENLSEVNLCKNIVNLYIKQYGEEYRNKIGIITPFKNQARLLSTHIPKVDIGTVHSFQGQEKEIIILSTAIDDTQKNNGVSFVGRKPNFLNVAFTRAKKQLIVVGNYEAYKNSNNYLMYAVETIEKYGYIYSIYKTELTENIDKVYVQQFLDLFKMEKSPSQRYEELFKEYTVNGLMVTSQNHHDFLLNAIQKSKKSIFIVCPWITNMVVNNEMLELVRHKINADNKLAICFGYKHTKYTLDQAEKIVEADNFGDKKGHLEAINRLKDIIKENLKYSPPIHTKALIIDEEFMLIGSHNWLSNSGSEKNTKDEISCIIDEKEMIDYVKRRYF